LDIFSNTKGLLIPRVTTENRENIPSPAQGLMVYDKDLGNYYIYTASGWRLMQEGFWLFNSGTNTVYLADNAYKVGVGTSAPTGKFEIVGDASLSDELPLFEVKNKLGRTVFCRI